MSEHGKITTYYTARGHIRYQIQIWHKGLGQQQTIRGTYKNDVWIIAQKKMQQWDRMSRIYDNKQLALEKTSQAQEEFQILDNLLLSSLKTDNSIDWESIKDNTDYEETVPAAPIIPKMDFITKLIPAWREKFERRVRDQQEKYKQELIKWENSRSAFIQKRDEENKLVDEKKEKYLNGDVSAFVDYCDMVLANSNYPGYFPQEFELDYIVESKLLVVEYQLPAPEQIPTLQEVTFIQSRNTFKEKHIAKTKFNILYDNVIYQIVLRTIHELYNSDKIDAIQSIVFNGYVKSIDPATGHEVEPCILTIQANKDEFRNINLANVEPKVCFKA